MRPDEDRSFEPRTIDPADPEILAAEAERYQVEPEDVIRAVEAVGPNRVAVELWLAGPAA
jgi:hypothetical protein